MSYRIITYMTSVAETIKFHRLEQCRKNLFCEGRHVMNIERITTIIANVKGRRRPSDNITIVTTFQDIHELKRLIHNEERI